MLFNFMEFISPKFNLRNHPAGVYKMTFNGTWFYIGSSMNLRVRISNWKIYLRTKKQLHDNILAIYDKINNVLFEVIEFGNEKTEVRLLEQRHINAFKGDKFLLNCNPTVIKRIAKFSLDNNLIEIFNTKIEACESLKCRDTHINEHLIGLRSRVSGFILKEVDENGNIIESIKYKSKKHSIEKFHLIDKDKNILDTFFYLASAAEKLKLNPHHISRVLRGLQHQTKGNLFILDSNLST